jgi:hypothetical protein
MTEIVLIVDVPFENVVHDLFSTVGVTPGVILGSGRAGLRESEKGEPRTLGHRRKEHAPGRIIQVDAAADDP